MLERVQVFILTHNRPNKIQFAINSVLKQTYRNIELIISDNSTNDETQNLLSKNYFNKFKYVKRNLLLDPIEHLNIVLSEVNANFFMMFHDDDIMFDSMVDCLIKAFSEFPKAAAIGANAFLCYDDSNSNELIFSSHDKDLVLSEISQIAKQYLVRNGIVPFPSFMYKSDVSKKVRLDSENGKNFSDAAFIMDISKIGQIIYLKKPLMNYFVNTNNLHVPDIVMCNIKFIDYLEKNIHTQNSYSIVQQYQIKAKYMELKQGLLLGKINILSRNYLFLTAALFRNSTFYYFPRSIFISFLVIFNINTRRIKIGK
jgi:glycosyltransferase involved in cell wall biosynthesis